MQTITFNNGIEMPIIGYGTYQIENQKVQECVENALSVGYRSIDTAAIYANESGIGHALQNALKGGIKREDLFITTKLWINNVNEIGALRGFEESLKKLQLDYIDLYLIHQPYNDVYGAWRSMSRLYREGRIKAIGVSNFYPDRLLDFCMHNEITPAINQIECHPFNAKFKDQAEMDKLHVVTQSWASFAEGKNDIFNNQTLLEIAKKYQKSVAQVILRWLIQRNIVVIPKTLSKERMIENINIFDFNLNSEDIAQIAKLDTRTTLFLNHRDLSAIEFLNSLHKDKN